MKRIVLLFLLLAVPALGQSNIRWDATASTTGGVGTLVPILAMPGSSVAFFNACSTTPCSPTRATTYTSANSTTTCPTGAQVVWQLPFNQACTSYADSRGEFGAYFQPGAYEYTFSHGGLTYGPYYFNVGGGGSTFNIFPTVMPVWVDPRAFGAACDGVADDTVALNQAAAATATLSTPAQPWGLFIPNTGHACTTTTGITMPTSSSLPVYIDIQGVLRATASQTSLISIGTSSAFVAGGSISGSGTIDANGLAQNAVWVHNLNDFTVKDVLINNATVSGVRWGDQSISGSFGGITTNVRFIVYNLTVSPPVFLPKTTGSIAEFMDNSTDNHSVRNEERGYDIGVSAEGGSDFIIEDHCWGHSGQVPSTCFIDRGNGDFWIGDYADSPSGIGFHMMSARDTIIAPKVLCSSPFCPTNTVVGIQFDNAAPGATVENGFFAGTSGNLLLSDLGGSTAAINTLRLGGNISGGNIATVHTANYEQIPYGAAIATTSFQHFSGGTFPSYVANSQFGFPSISGSVVTFPSSGSNSTGSLWSSDSNGNTTLINVPNTGATPATLDLSTWTSPQPPSTFIYSQMTGFGQVLWNATNTLQPWTYAWQKNGTVVFGYDQAGHVAIPALTSPGFITNNSSGELGSTNQVPVVATPTPGGTCTSNGFISAVINGTTVHLATCN